MRRHPPNFIVLLWLLTSSMARAYSPVTSNDVPAPDPNNTQFNPHIFVEQQTNCMKVSDIKNALASVLKSREESTFMIFTVAVSPGVDGNVAILRAIDRETGEIFLERRLTIADGECDKAHLVLKVMVEQFLTGFPIEKWKEKQTESQKPADCPPQKIIPPTRNAPLSWLFQIGVDSRLPSPSGDVELGLGIDAGGVRHGVASGVSIRAGWPHPLGDGRYIEGAAQLSLGWRFSPNDLLVLKTEVRTGALLVSGIGYEKNYHQWLVMFEVQLALLFRLGAVLFGPEIAISPLFHKVFTETGEERDLPWLRIGVLLGIPLGPSFAK